MLGPAVERLSHHRAHQSHQSADRILGEVRKRDVALLTGDHERAGERAAPADLHRIAEYGRVARLAHDAMVEALAALGGPLQELDRAVDGIALLVAGDEE